MKQSLQLRVSQHLALTPQLQQSIRLLQLSTLELHQELEQILAENPMLERTDDPLDHATRLLADGAISTSSSTSTTTDDTPVPAAAENTPATDIDNTPESVASESDWSFDDVARTAPAPEDDDGRPQLEAQEHTLREHLLEQASLTVREPRDRALLELIIDALDDNGYLEETLEEIHARLPPELEIELEELGIALTLLQSMEPAGVGARNASECLALQIRRLPGIPFVTRRMALQIVEHHLPLFAQRDFSKLRRALDCDDEDLREAQAVIKQCHPHPGASFASNTSD